MLKNFIFRIIFYSALFGFFFLCRSEQILLPDDIWKFYGVGFFAIISTGFIFVLLIASMYEKSMRILRPFLTTIVGFFVCIFVFVLITRDFDIDFLASAAIAGILSIVVIEGGMLWINTKFQE